MTSESPEQVVAGVASTLAVYHPELWRQLLDTHISDNSGRCGACSSGAGHRPVWPCTLRIIAEIAEELSRS
jgi:hypothetical protein